MNKEFFLIRALKNGQRDIEDSGRLSGNKDGVQETLGGKL